MTADLLFTSAPTPSHETCKFVRYARRGPLTIGTRISVVGGGTRWSRFSVRVYSSACYLSTIPFIPSKRLRRFQAFVHQPKRRDEQGVV